LDAIVAINSIPQHDVAKGNGHIEFERANPTALSSVVAKNLDLHGRQVFYSFLFQLLL